MSGLLVFALNGCATPTALTPVAVPCAPKDSPSPPAITANADLAKLDDFKLVIVIAQERLTLIDYSAKASAIIEACR